MQTTPMATRTLPLHRRKVLIAGHAAPSLLRGLLAYWKMEEASGTRYDAIGGHHLAQQGGVSQVAGKLGYGAGILKNSSQYLTQDDAALRLDDFTAAGWVKLGTASGYQDIFDRWNVGLNYKAWALERITGGDDRLKLFFWISGAGRTLTTVAPVPTGIWVYAVIRSDESGAIGAAHGQYLDLRYNDGSEVAISLSQTNVAAPDSTDAGFSIGASSDGGNPANVDVDEVGYWNRAVSAAEIASLYNGGDGRGYPFR